LTLARWPVPIFNETQNLTLGFRVSRAGNPLTRLAGLLGTRRPDRQMALYILPCAGIHTFGMKYPLDIVFLGAEGRVVKLIRHLAPNKMTGTVPSAKSALEFPAGTIAEGEIRIGDRLRITVDKEHGLGRAAITTLLHWPVNLSIAAVWSLFVYASYLRWQQTGQIVSLGLIAVNAVVCVLFLTRRESTDVSHRPADWVVAFAVVGLEMLMRAHAATGSLLAAVAVPVQAAGIGVLIGSLLSLGRSFGLVPANRGIKRAGLYRMVRHPAYAGELILCLGLLLADPSIRGLGFALLISAGLVYRIFSEERILMRDPEYRAYVRDTKYRLIPRIF
jgi:protein-S-isoprenylcysteine O-methyltransferase Ste14/uncharacterized membrane protein (UPF0127 family)